MYKLYTGKEIIHRTKELLEKSPELQNQYNHARKIIKIFSKSGYYELTSRCNLRCEGCYYFLSDREYSTDDSPAHEWRSLFAREKKRGVSMGYFVGAEPSLVQKTLHAAAEFIPHGNIGTNGTVKIHPDIPYTIHISLWGNEKLDTKLRGASLFKKILKNYHNDRRALILYTFNRWNIQDASAIVAACQDNGIAITFNLFSPTHRYLNHLQATNEIKSPFFRVSCPEDNLTIQPEQYQLIQETTDALLDEYPTTVLYSKSYSKFITAQEPIYQIDTETGIAKNCRSQIKENLLSFNAKLESTTMKCCTPEVDCKQCRLYSGGWSGHLELKSENLQNLQTFHEWLDNIFILGKIFTDTVYLNDSTQLTEGYL